MFVMKSADDHYRKAVQAIQAWDIKSLKEAMSESKGLLSLVSSASYSNKKLIDVIIDRCRIAGDADEFLTLVEACTIDSNKKISHNILFHVFEEGISSDSMIYSDAIVGRINQGGKRFDFNEISKSDVKSIAMRFPFARDKGENKKKIKHVEKIVNVLGKNGGFSDYTTEDMDAELSSTPRNTSKYAFLIPFVGCSDKTRERIEREMDDIISHLTYSNLKSSTHNISSPKNESDIPMYYLNILGKAINFNPSDEFMSKIRESMSTVKDSALYPAWIINKIDIEPLADGINVSAPYLLNAISRYDYKVPCRGEFTKESYEGLSSLLSKSGYDGLISSINSLTCDESDDISYKGMSGGLSRSLNSYSREGLRRVLLKQVGSKNASLLAIINTSLKEASNDDIRTFLSISEDIDVERPALSRIVGVNGHSNMIGRLLSSGDSNCISTIIESVGGLDTNLGEYLGGQKTDQTIKEYLMKLIEDSEDDVASEISLAILNEKIRADKIESEKAALAQPAPNPTKPKRRF